MDKLCKNCKHVMWEGPTARDAKCNAPQNYMQTQDMATYLVNGVEQPKVTAVRGANCVALRMDRDPVTLKLVCGPSGKWFQEKE